MNFLRALISGDETSVDSAIFCMLLMLAVFLGISGYLAYTHPETFSLWSFTTSGGSIIGIPVAAKTGRDRWGAPPAQPAQPQGLQQ